MATWQRAGKFTIIKRFYATREPRRSQALYSARMNRFTNIFAFSCSHEIFSVHFDPPTKQVAGRRRCCFARYSCGCSGEFNEIYCENNLLKEFNLI